MRAVFVNHCHPDMAHVCALRLRAFAEACAKAGDHIVLLTQTLGDACGSEYDLATLPAALAAHHWETPFRLACAPKPLMILEALRAGKIRPPLRQAVVAWQYLTQGGMFTDWREGSRPYWQVLADAFKPDVVWSSFGNSDVLQIAQGIAHKASCPWVLDMKDPWDVFIPKPFRAFLAARFRDAAALTAFSEQHAKAASQRFGKMAHVIYSGIGPEFLQSVSVQAEKDFTLLLTGGLYDGIGLDAIIAGIAAFLETLPASDRAGVRFCYAGGEGDRFLAAARRLACRTETLGFCSLPELAAKMRAVHVNLYVRSPASLFQHKLFELVAAGRPIVCLPDESEEAKNLSKRLGGKLMPCESATRIAQTLQSLYAQMPSIVMPKPELGVYSWNHQAEILRHVLADAAKGAAA